MKNRRPRMAFVVVTTAAALTGACRKEGGGECKPPDCHMNPPPLSPTPHLDAGSGATPSAAPDAGK